MLDCENAYKFVKLIFLTKTKHIVGIQKNDLNETILLHTQKTYLNRQIRKESQFILSGL